MARYRSPRVSELHGKPGRDDASWQTRGYFGVGIEGGSKAMNVGAIFRTAHAFGASFLFSVALHKNVRRVRSDTAGSVAHIPYHEWDSVEDLALPKACRLVGVELSDAAVDLPAFRHPLSAAYLFGPERGVLSDDALERCHAIVQIPARFCVNVSVAAGIVVYDRMLSLGAFAERPAKYGIVEK
ncbi:MAG: RNA methyltransferase [Pseudomonadota bacterium]